MRARLLVGMVVVVALGIGAAVAPANVTNVKTSLPWQLTPYDDPYEPQAKASVKGDAEAPAQPYCEAGRKIELFRDGKKIGSASTDKYGVWYLSIDPLVPGRYVAKAKKSRLPSKTNPVNCKAAQSKPVVITPEIVAGVTS
jgi:hypothetical protein